MDGREERGEATRRSLMSAARRAFADRGYAAASVRDIAADAGAHPALVTYHFGSKAALYERVVTTAFGELHDRVVQSLASHADRRQGAIAALDGYLLHLSKDPSFAVLIQRAVLDRDPVVLDILRPALSALLSVVQSQSVDLGEELMGDPEQLFLSFLGASVSPYLFAPMLEGVFSADVLAHRNAYLRALLERILG